MYEVIKIYNNHRSTFRIRNRFHTTIDTISETNTINTATEHQTLDIVEGSTPSEAQEVMAQEEPGMGSPGHSES
jgi:hypothetical protein